MALDKYITRDEDGEGWGFDCPVTDRSCGTRNDDGSVTPFSSRQWPTKKLALARFEEHVADHKGEAPMSTLDEFRRKHGLSVQDGRAIVTVEDL